MKINDILNALKHLGETNKDYRTVYRNLLNYIEVDEVARDFYVNELEGQNFASIKELKDYVDAIYIDQ